ncbi:MAG: ECF-type sigma factor [Planctomycetes bacterium]|nr:ECF-type sigma factor [Planctomycetota bacterium]
MTDDAPGLQITLLLERMSGGDSAARDAVFERLYGELRDVAGYLFQGQPAGHTLQATALVHEAWLRLSSLKGFTFRNRDHFMGVAARAMRHVLVDHARSRNSSRAGGDREREPLDAVTVLYEERSVDLAVLDLALRDLEALDPRAVRVVECRFFGGMTSDQIARSLDITSRSVERDWRFARAWLRKALG